jgi:hypothetical protein
MKQSDRCHLTGDPDPKDIGPVIPDPWDDPEQTDWPMNPEGGTDGGPDEEPGQAPN